MPAISTDLRGLLANEDALAGLAPALRSPAFADAEVAQAASRAWPLTTSPADRLAWLEIVLARPGSFEDAATFTLWRAASRDPASSVRERAVEAVGSSPAEVWPAPIPPAPAASGRSATTRPWRAQPRQPCGRKGLTPTQSRRTSGSVGLGS